MEITALLDVGCLSKRLPFEHDRCTCNIVRPVNDLCISMSACCNSTQQSSSSDQSVLVIVTYCYYDILRLEVRLRASSSYWYYNRRLLSLPLLVQRLHIGTTVANGTTAAISSKLLRARLDSKL